MFANRVSGWRRIPALWVVIGMGVFWAGTGVSAAATIPTVLVRNGGNGPDPATGGLYGSVPSSYRIAQHEVTNAQYTEFLNLVDPAGLNTLSLFHPEMATHDVGGILLEGDAVVGSRYAVRANMAEYPVAFVSWIDALRFANWLHNGQGTGDTEHGAYTIVPVIEPPGTVKIVRNPDALWFLPSENEWYKAAYHKNDGVTANYWSYPTASDTPPTAETPPGGAHSANLNNVVGRTTPVGAYASSTSPYGTWDQAGNLFEWTETLDMGLPVIRGGYYLNPAFATKSTTRLGDRPLAESYALGFRVATVPEPQSAITITTLVAVCLAMRQRRRQRPGHASRFSAHQDQPHGREQNS